MLVAIKLTKSSHYGNKVTAAFLFSDKNTQGLITQFPQQVEPSVLPEGHIVGIFKELKVVFVPTVGIPLQVGQDGRGIVWDEAVLIELSGQKIDEVSLSENYRPYDGAEEIPD